MFPPFVRNFRTIFQIFALCFLFLFFSFLPVTLTSFIHFTFLPLCVCVCVVSYIFIYLSHILRSVRVICLINVRKKELFGAIVVSVVVVVGYCYCWRFLFASSYLILHIVATFCFCFGFPSHCLSRLVFCAQCFVDFSHFPLSSIKVAPSQVWGRLKSQTDFLPPNTVNRV